MSRFPQALASVRSFDRSELQAYFAANGPMLLEDEALAILDNPHCNARICAAIAQSRRLTSFHSVRLRLVAHRAAPRADALRFIAHLHWPDLVRLSVEVTVPPAVRRAIDVRLLQRLGEMTVGEQIAAARRCSLALVKALLTLPDERILGALLINQRLREEDLVAMLSSSRVTAAQIAAVAADFKWSQRPAVRMAIAMNPAAPRAVAASQLRHLSRRDLERIREHPATTVYVRRCIERLVDR